MPRARSRRAIGAAGLVVVAVTFLGCGRATSPNLLLITIDTLRKDVLRTYGGTEAVFPQPVAPGIDALADHSVVIDSCYTVCPRTTQSMATLFTGLDPARHGAVGLFHALRPDVQTLAEILHEKGYRTEAVVTNHFLQSGRGFEQGFDVYDDRLFHQRTEYAQNVLERVDLLTLEKSVGPYFLWVHFLDPHWPYDPPPEALALFDQHDDRPFTLYADIDSNKVTRGEVIFKNSLDRETRRHVQASYLAEVRYLDGYVKRMLEVLRNRGLLDNTLVVLCADHGESMGEHAYYYAHGETLYQGTVTIPALFHYSPGRGFWKRATGWLGGPRISGALKPGRMKGLVSNADLMPTMLDLMGVGVPPGLDGRSLAAAMREGKPSPRESVTMESDYQLIYPENPRFHIPGPRGKWRAVVMRGHKLLRVPNPAGDELELYDLTYDPFEMRNAIETSAAIRDALTPRLDAFGATVDGERIAPGAPDSTAQSALRSLGYVN